MAAYCGLNGWRWLAVGIALGFGTSLTLRVGVGAESARVSWTTSKVVGSPDAPPPFRVVRAFENLRFDKPLLLVRMPGSERLFLGEQGGTLYSFVNQPGARAELFCDLKAELKTVGLLAGAQGIDALYGLAFHPEFEKNRQCFVCYTLRGGGRGERNLEDGTRVSRFLVTNTEPPRIDPASEQIVITFLQGGHNGGDLHFGPDGMLYISTGDAANPNPPDRFNTGQDISDLLSSILRIDVNRKEAGKSYAVPADNPFVKMPGARPEVWAYGFRNPWRMSFDRETGELFVGDVGWELWEMVHRIEKGGNYGWAAMEGPQPVKPEQVGPTPIIPALIALPHTISASVTGGYVYRGQKFPELRGAYLFGDWETRRIWGARFDGDRVVEMPELTKPSIRIGACGEDNAGEIYFLDHDNGTLHTLERNAGTAANAEFPTRLSQTGLFTDVKTQSTAPGVYPFWVNSHQWQDGAAASHYVAFRGDSSAVLHERAKPIPGMVYWHNFRMHFPENAVLMKTIRHGGRAVETQLLHFDGVDWLPYTYAWRADGSDADLVPAEGAESELSIEGQKVLWQFHSRSQCLSCHSAWSEYALGYQPEQLNLSPGREPNQLVTFSELGLIRRVAADGKELPPFDAESAGKERKLHNPFDEKGPLEDRARAYLHTNCGHCHTFGGGGAVNLNLRFPIAVNEMKAVDVPPQRGNFGIADACIIKPGEPWASTLYFRMAKFGRDRMPHLGSEKPDKNGLRLIEAWISGMDADLSRSGITLMQNKTADVKLSDPRSAVLAARTVPYAEPSERAELLSAAAKLPAGPIRDLFEGYLPADPKGRKLGSSPRPRAILTLSGDAKRGEALFWSSAVNCGKCHKVGERGTAVGPELTSIARQRTAEDLLASMLEPSQRIEPKFAAYLARAVDGRVVTGLLVKRDEAEVVLRDGENKEIRLAAADIEQMRPAGKSLMADGQLASLTAEEAADLLAYLVSCK